MAAAVAGVVLLGLAYWVVTGPRPVSRESLARRADAKHTTPAPSDRAVVGPGRPVPGPVTHARAEESQPNADLRAIDNARELGGALEQARKKRQRYLEVIERAPETRDRIASMANPDAALEAFDQRLENATQTLRAVDARIEQIEARLEEIGSDPPPTP